MASLAFCSAPDPNESSLIVLSLPRVAAIFLISAPGSAPFARMKTIGPLDLVSG